jgi:GalNAc-alpha-(1->4)-GalNAc-alpha-(1->3)-diNAcBac-PP-undecaprenol alpha-1,4-N-acetyl-D-galactosaminyltransferase
MSEVKKICLVIHSLQAGGMERVMSELAIHFSKKTDVEVHVVLYGINRDIFYSIPSNIVIHKPPFAFVQRLRWLSTARTLYFIRQKIKQISPTAILSFGEYWNSFVLLATIGLKYPLYISDRNQPDKSLGRLHDKLRSHLYPRASGIIAQTRKAKEIHSRLYGHKNVKVIGNPIRRVDEDPTVVKENAVLMVGRLITSKHQDKLIEMFLNIDMPDWKLYIVGYDHLKQTHSERLRQMVRTRHAEDRVILTGKQSNVDDYYRRSRVFAFTSSSEGFPNVIGEAMSAGLPVIAFDCIAGPSEMIVDDQNGFLIPLFDYMLFEKKLKMLMMDSELRTRMAKSGRERIKEFSLARVGEEYYTFITSSVNSITEIASKNQ